MEEFEEETFLEEEDPSEGKYDESDHDNSALEDNDLLEDVRPAPQRLRRSTSYCVLPQQEIVQESSKLIKEVQALCDLPTSAAASALLRAFKWNKDQLIDAFLENSDKACEKAGLSKLEFEHPAKEGNDSFDCLICLETLPASTIFSLTCGHRYCCNCWRDYLEIKVKDGPSCVIARCPSPKCKAIVHELAYKKLVDVQYYEKYQYYFTRSFVENNDYVKWCSSPGCSNAIRCDSLTRKLPVYCRCGYAFCFNCADIDMGDHSPAPCNQVRKWKKKANEESENVKWMLQNTKKCPKCRSPIEKNGGCMHMTCRNAQCQFEFCWLCRGPWTEHGQATGGFYQCNKYDVSKDKKDYSEKPSDGKTELETYMFYFHRYESHKQALAFANEQRNKCNQKAEQFMERFGIHSADTKFLSDATEQLIANRRVLQYSYIMGYYLDKSKQVEKNLFEYLQEDMEKHTNELSTSYEHGNSTVMSYQVFIKWKEDLANKTRVTQKFLDNFLEGVAEGLIAHA